MIPLTPHDEGWILPVHAQPGARKSGVGAEHGGALKVTVTARPVEGQANKAVVEAVRKALGLKRSQIELVAGTSSREKRLLIRGLSRPELERRLAEVG